MSWGSTIRCARCQHCAPGPPGQGHPDLVAALPPALICTFACLYMPQAELSYQKAAELNDKAPTAWQGLSEVHHACGAWARAAEADQALVDLAHRGEAALSARLPALVRRLGEALARSGQLEEAEVALRDALGHDLPRAERLGLLSQLADVQLQEDGAELEAKVAARLADALAEAGGDASKARGTSSAAQRSVLKFSSTLSVVVPPTNEGPAAPL